MKTLMNELRRLREAAGLTKVDLGAMVGVSDAMIGHWEKGREVPTLMRVRQIASALQLDAPTKAILERMAAVERTDPEERRELLKARPEAQLSGPSRPVAILAQRQGERYQAVNEREESYGEVAGLVAIRVLHDPAAAGPGRTITDADVEGWGVIHRNWCPHPEQTDYVRVKGDSMEPTLPDGALVTIDRAERDADKLVGHVVAIWRGEPGEVTIKRLLKSRETGRYVASPDNRSAEHVPFEVDLEDEDRIIGHIRSVHAPVK